MATAPRKTPKSDTRLRSDARSGGESRVTRSVTADKSRTDKDGTALTKAERQKMIRDEFRQEALPRAPEIPGYHVCWLSSTSSYDPIHKRTRMGYEPVTVQEVAGMEHLKMGTGEHAGVIACNEMLLFKIRQEIYEEIMMEFHNDAPLREEESIVAQLKRGQKDSKGQELDEVEGFEDLAVRRPTPAFN